MESWLPRKKAWCYTQLGTCRAIYLLNACFKIKWQQSEFVVLG